MSRPPLTGAEKQLIYLLCEHAIEQEHVPDAFRDHIFNQFDDEDFERARDIMAKLEQEEPRETYTPQTGRL